MNTKYKVGQRVKVISGANVTADIFNGMEGVITEIQDNGTPKVMIYVDFENGYKIWCYTQNHRGIELNVEILEPDTDSPVKWRKIDKDNLYPDKVVVMNIIQPTQIFTGTLELNRYDDATIYLGNGQYLSNFTHYIPLSDLLNLPISE